MKPHFDVEIHEWWAGVSQAGQGNYAHVHPNSELSGVLYVDVPRNPGDLVFSDPRGLMAESFLGGTRIY